MLVTLPKPIGRKSRRPASRSSSSMLRNRAGKMVRRQRISRSALSSPALALCACVYASMIASCSCGDFSHGIGLETSTFCAPSILIFFFMLLCLPFLCYGISALLFLLLSSYPDSRQADQQNALRSDADG